MFELVTENWDYTTEDEEVTRERRMLLLTTEFKILFRTYVAKIARW